MSGVAKYSIGAFINLSQLSDDNDEWPTTQQPFKLLKLQKKLVKPPPHSPKPSPHSSKPSPHCELKLPYSEEGYDGKNQS